MLSQKTVEIAEILTHDGGEACQKALLPTSLYQASRAEGKRFSVLKFNDIHIREEVQIKSAFLFYKTTQPFAATGSQTLYIVPIDSLKYASCDNLDDITDLEEATQPWLITEWEVDYDVKVYVGVSPDISTYIKHAYSKNFPEKFSMNFLVFWKTDESEVALDINLLELVINYQHFPGGNHQIWSLISTNSIVLT